MWQQIKAVNNRFLVMVSMLAMTMIGVTANLIILLTRPPVP